MKLEIVKTKVKIAGTYFQIIYQIDGEKFIHIKVSDKNCGIKLFNNQMRDVEQMSPDAISVELYSFGTTKMRTKPDEVIVLKDNSKRSQKQEFRGFGDLGALGGIENFINTAVTARSATERVDSLRDENDKLARKVNSYENTIENIKQDREKSVETLKQENWLLFKEVETLKGNIVSLEKEKLSEIERLKNQNSSLQNYLPAIGTIAARIMGLNGEQMRGLLGIPDDDTEQIASAPSNNENAPKFSFKKDEAPHVPSNNEILSKILATSEEKTAEIMIAEVTKMFSDLLNANQSKYIKQIYKIFAFSTSNDDNLNLVTDLIFNK